MSGRVGIEVGGTFTDLIWQKDDGELHVCKVASTPNAVHQAIMNALTESGARMGDIGQLIHGSTVATNTLLTRSGALTGLLTTRGFRDVIAIGTHDRQHNVYEIFFRKPKPPIRREQIAEIDERLRPDGSVLKPIDPEAVWHAVEPMIAAGVDSIAICFLHAYANAAHERAAAEAIRARAPNVYLSLSSDVSPEFREYERSVTTTVNAFVQPVVEAYVDKLQTELGCGGYGGVLQIMQSSGGIMPAAVAGRNAVRMLLSGPSAGVRGAVWFARRNGISDILTLDMGGTSTDVSLAPGLMPATVPQIEIDGLPIRTAAVDIVTVGAGGGSIASVDAGGFINVGPQSAGAMPGPACYGRGGTKATVADAQVIAGLLRPERFHGGKLVLRKDLAETALRDCGAAGSIREIADSILRIANNNMAQAVRLVSTARGIDPSGFTLVAYGGGGPLHAALVADEIGITQVLVPWAPGLGSAFGLLVADMTIDLVESRHAPLDDSILSDAQVRQLKERCAAAAAENGLSLAESDVALGVDLRYVGQAYEITVWGDATPRTGAELRSAFEALHQQRYGYARDRLAVQVVNYRLRLSRRTTRETRTPPVTGTGPVKGEASTIFLNGAEHEAVYYERERLPVGTVIEGAAIIEEATSTTVVPPQWQARVAPTGDLLLKRIAE